MQKPRTNNNNTLMSYSAEALTEFVVVVATADYHCCYITGTTSLVATLDHWYCHTTGRYTGPLRSLHVVTCCINYGGAVMELLAM